MKTLHKRSMIAIAALVASTAAVAQTSSGASSTTSAPAPQTQKGFTGEHRSGVWSGETFSRLDTNRDGMISREEAQADATVHGAWSKLDPRNTGKVSRADFDKFGANQPSGTSESFNSAGPVPTTKPKS